MDHISKIHCIEDKLTEIVMEQLDTDDISSVSTAELGEVIDMIKDLAETKEELYKASYYDSVVKAMSRTPVEGASGDHHEAMLMEHPDDFATKSAEMLRKAWGYATPETRKHMKSIISKLDSDMVV